MQLEWIRLRQSSRGSNRGPSGSAGVLARFPEAAVPAKEVRVKTFHLVRDKGMKTFLE